MHSDVISFVYLPTNQLPAMLLQDAKQILKDTIQKSLTHKDYKRVTDLAKKYKRIITGEGLEEELRQFVRREDKDLFEQRCKITKHITPAVCDGIMKPAFKIPRVDNINKQLIFKDDNNGEKKKELEGKISKFFGDSSLDTYLSTRFLQLSFSDPNAFVVVEFDQFDPQKEKASPRPFEVSSEMAVNYLYKNNVLQWLIVKEGILYKDQDGKERSGFKYTMYLDNDIIIYTQVDPQAPKEEGILYEDLSTNGWYRVDFAQPKGGKVQAIRVGYKQDLVTDGRTCVSPLHPAMPWIDKSIKHVSEMDLSVALHVFPQKAVIARRCPGESLTNSCMNGQAALGGVCKACNGSGSVVNKTAADVVEVPEPKSGDPFPDLSKYIAYFTPEIAGIKWMDDYVDKLELKAFKAVYNSETFTKDQIQKTATGENIDLDNIYDTLFPLSEQFSISYVYLSSLIAVFTDNNAGLTIIHKFPRDFKFKTETQLIADLKTANDSGAPAFLKQEISKDIARLKYRDNPSDFKKYEVRNYFMPFLGKSETDIQFIISSGLTTQYNKLLWANFDIVFDDLEREILGFYDLPYKAQVSFVNQKVDELKAEIGSDTSLAISFNSGGIGGEGNAA